MKNTTLWVIGLAATGALAFAVAKRIRSGTNSEVGKSWIEACDEATKNLQLKLETFQKAS